MPDLMFPIADVIMAHPLSHPISARAGYWGALERKLSSSSYPANQM